MESINPNLMKSKNGKLFIYSPEYDTVKERLERKWFVDDKIVRFISVLDFSDEFISDLSKISAAAIMSDKFHQKEETFVVSEICKELNIRWDDFEILLNKEISETGDLKYRNVKDYLVQSRFGADTKNIMLLFEASMHIVLADGIMTEKESKLLADICDILNIPVHKLISRISQFISFEREVLVDVE